MDIDREEAPSLTMSGEQRELLVAVTRSQVSSMSSVTAADGAGKERQKRSTRAAILCATSMRDGTFSSRLIVGWEHRSRSLTGARQRASVSYRPSRRSASHSTTRPPSADISSLHAV